MVELAKDKKILLLHRSGGELDDDCGMAYFWNQVYANEAAGVQAGIVPKKEAIYLQVGRETHEDLAMIAEMEDISPEALRTRCAELTATLTDEDRLDRAMMEVLYRRLGWLVAFALFVEPDLRRDFETVYLEDELILDRTPLWVPVTPDRVLRDRKDGRLVYWEWKSTMTTGFKWTNSWPYAIQLHIGMKAIEEELGEAVKYSQIIGLYKGYESQADHALNHAYVWAYRNTGTGEWTHDYQKGRGASWERAPVWEYPGGIVSWVERLGKEVAQGMFPRSPQVHLNEMMLDGWVRRKTARMEAIDKVRATSQWDRNVREVTFEQRSKRCRPAFGDACPYLGLCWNASMNDRPMASGLYQPRVPHHEVEQLWLEERKRGEVDPLGTP
jgi:hypothetical protein